MFAEKQEDILFQFHFCLLFSPPPTQVDDQNPFTAGEDKTTKLFNTYFPGWPEMRRALDPTPTASRSGASSPFGAILLPVSRLPTCHCCCSWAFLVKLPCFPIPFSLILVGFILEGERFIRRKSRVTGEEETGRKMKEEDREQHKQ